ncbi:MAG: [FeFe] hydrogenase, group A [Clostridiales bacterium]|jgi:iron-only hydrogenase group A|nr:[FeFe] hydrogenase, group A [Clostridiales bacterium]
MPKLTIDNIQVEAEPGDTILKAAAKIGIKIPTLCHHPDQAVKANCRICVVEVEGQRVLQPACSFPASEGLIVKTNSSKARLARRNILELILAHHNRECLTCPRGGGCELQTVSEMLNFNGEIRYENHMRGHGKDYSSPSIVRDPSKCIVCERCIYACSQIQTVNVLSKENRGFHTTVATAYNLPLSETSCVFCGQCVQACPVGALTMRDDTKEVWKAIEDPDKWVVAQCAPTVRITLAEALGEPPGTVSTGRLVTAMRALGFNAVFDTDFSADLTIMEEGSELLHRIQNGGTLPMITSCSPGWVNFCEAYYDDQLAHLSTCKSPQQMFGAVLKTYYADKCGRDIDSLYSVSIMPCTAKKHERLRPAMASSGRRDVDCVLTVQELARMIKSAGLDFARLPESDFDLPFGLGSGAGEIFGATGGVMEAALRTVYEIVTGRELENIEFTDVRGFAGVKEAAVDLDGTEVKIAVAHGLSNARLLMDQLREGQSPYHFIEVMACPGGCIGGGGNPIKNWAKMDKRLDAVYETDRSLPIRKSHKNPAIKQLYDEFLKEPLGELPHKLLHTHYSSRAALTK